MKVMETGTQITGAIDRFAHALLRSVEEQRRAACNTGSWQWQVAASRVTLSCVGDILQVNRLYCTGAYLVKATDTCGYVKYARSLFWHARTCYRHLVEDDEILEAVLEGGKGKQGKRSVASSPLMAATALA